MLVSLQVDGVAATPLKVTVDAPWVMPKLDPVIVMEVPALPLEGERLVITGPVLTLKTKPLLFTLDSLTTTLPVTAPTGTEVTMAVSLQSPTVAVVPLNATVLLPCVAPNPVPEIITGVPTGPDTGVRSVIFSPAALTVRLTDPQFEIGDAEVMEPVAITE